MIIQIIIFAVGALVVGGVRFSLLVPRLLTGKDIVELSEDKNPGCANAFKYAGVPVGILCLVLDLAKGALPVMLACRFLDMKNLLFALVIVAPVCGHAFNPRRGGKAIAVSFGALTGLIPYSFSVAWLVFFYLFFSLIVRINPHEKRSVFSFFFFGICSAAYALIVNQLAIMSACILISGIVILKNRKGEIKVGLENAEKLDKTYAPND